MTIIRPPYALEREPPRIAGSGSIGTLNIPEDEAKTIVKHPIGFSPPPKPEQEPKTERPSKREIQ